MLVPENLLDIMSYEILFYYQWKITTEQQYSRKFLTINLSKMFPKVFGEHSSELIKKTIVDEVLNHGEKIGLFKRNTWEDLQKSNKIKSGFYERYVAEDGKIRSRFKIIPLKNHNDPDLLWLKELSKINNNKLTERQLGDKIALWCKKFPDHKEKFIELFDLKGGTAKRVKKRLKEEFGVEFKNLKFIPKEDRFKKIEQEMILLNNVIKTQNNKMRQLQETIKVFIANYSIGTLNE